MLEVDRYAPLERYQTSLDLKGCVSIHMAISMMKRGWQRVYFPF